MIPQTSPKGESIRSPYLHFPSDDQAQSLGGSGVLGGRVEPPVRVLGGRVEPPVVTLADPAFDWEETQAKVRVYV